MKMGLQTSSKRVSTTRWDPYFQSGKMEGRICCSQSEPCQTTQVLEEQEVLRQTKEMWPNRHFPIKID